MASALKVSHDHTRITYAVSKILLPKLCETTRNKVRRLDEIVINDGINCVSEAIEHAVKQNSSYEHAKWYRDGTIIQRNKTILTSVDICWEVARKLDLWGDTIPGGNTPPSETAKDIVAFAYDAASYVPDLFSAFASQPNHWYIELALLDPTERQENLTIRWLTQ